MVSTRANAQRPPQGGEAHMTATGSGSATPTDTDNSHADRRLVSPGVLAELLDNAVDSVVAHTLEGDLLYANRAACEQWGCSFDDMCVRGPFAWVPQEQRPLIAARIDALRTSGDARFESTGTVADGRDVCYEVHSRLVETSTGPMVLSSMRDIGERIQTEEMVRYLAYHDTLTGLANRTLLGQELAHALAYADRHDDIVGVVFIDLNDFKPVNDTFGHAIGDHVLREVADRISGCVRETDTVARVGGDEFVVLLPRLGDARHLPAVARKLSEAIEQPMTVNDVPLGVTSSVGLALHERGEDADTLLTRADLAMYGSREIGVPGWDLFEVPKHRSSGVA